MRTLRLMGPLFAAQFFSSGSWNLNWSARSCELNRRQGRRDNLESGSRRGQNQLGTKPSTERLHLSTFLKLSSSKRTNAVWHPLPKSTAC